jgi:hypothetical protein
MCHHNAQGYAVGWRAASEVKEIKRCVKIYLIGVEKRITKASECL